MIAAPPVPVPSTVTDCPRCKVKLGLEIWDGKLQALVPIVLMVGDLVGCGWCGAEFRA